ncbi:hypothetical protein ACW9HR_38125 [Nocardia gipuzkoensis]|uniref:hypothetical protein n=1 Tax=Nocardia gipuzkoensis TaxID=2749991 RepID=UPI00237E2963|nr:hypothetical protein [Nocardia gipuzkoensis]MDE1675428.1 hypothetical protein [Nocardia gipuzkoensis]
MSGKAWGWVLFALGVVGVGSGIGLFVWLGLSQGDQLASVLSLFVGVAGLGVSIAGLVVSLRAQSVQPAQSEPPAQPTPPAQAVTGSSIGGNAEVFRNVRGDLTLTRTPAPSAPTAPVPTGASAATDPAATEQVITGSTIGGTARVVDGANNVTIDE